MTVSLFANLPRSQASRPGPPVGRAFATFGAVIVALSALGALELAGRFQPPSAVAAQFGIVATTTFAIAGILAFYRALTIANPWAWAIVAVLIGPGAVWTWATFIDGPGSPTSSSLVVLAAGTLSMVLLIQGLRLTHWLEVFGGLGSFGLVLVAVMVRLEPAATDSMSPALLAAVSGMICLYGLLVDLELAEHRSLVELTSSRERIQNEVARVEELLHDLRSGLLAIEAAIGSFDGELAGPLRAEAARLRRLTLAGARTVTEFDLADRVASLVASRRAGGPAISLDGPETATVWGEESEVLAIVDNLLANAERHGQAGTIRVAISTGEAGVELSVSNRGELPAGDPEAVFHRGFSTHPDGEGLGLARARMLADINGGQLRVGAAEPGHTTFVLGLQAQAPMPSPSAAASAASTDAPKRGMTSRRRERRRRSPERSPATGAVAPLVVGRRALRPAGGPSGGPTSKGNR